MPRLDGERDREGERDSLRLVLTERGSQLLEALKCVEAT